MRRIVVGDCHQERLLKLLDPDAPSEAEFENKVAKTLACVFPEYWCIVFSGGFRLDTQVYRPDLALVARNYSHWFVVEVELVSHSFDRHVLPQVRAFQYGVPLSDAAAQLAKELSISRSHAATLISHVPRNVAVVANQRRASWETSLRAHTIQLLTVSAFRSPSGTEALELDGDLEAPLESLGFGTYLATDRSLRFPSTVRLPTGAVQIHDPSGAPSLWTVVRDADAAWITKDVGLPSIPHGALVQLLRTIDGKITIRRPSSV